MTNITSVSNWLEVEHYKIYNRTRSEFEILVNGL